MDHINDNRRCVSPPRSLLQLLIPACRTVRQSEADYAWLHGYCLLTCSAGRDTVRLVGEVRIGERYAENSELLVSLAEGLDPAAILVGVDLTSTVSAFGKLPIDAVDPAPPLAVLSKLQSILRAHPPIDLGITEDTRELVQAERLTMDLAGAGSRLRRKDALSAEDIDSGNPRLLADKLAREAGNCLLAMGQLILPQAEQLQLDTAWRNWRQHLVPVLPTKEVPAETNA